MDAVIVTYNSAGDLAGLLACEPLRTAFDRLIVVDNGSTDGSATLARSAGCTVIERATNAGFGAGVNSGAFLTEGPAFMVLNPDIRFASSDVVRRLRRRLDDDAAVAIVAPALRLPDGTLQDSARSVPRPHDLVLRRLVSSQATRGAVNSVGPVATRVAWAVGACWLVRRSAYATVGGFDERYRLYFEDVELCVRMGRSGYKVIFDPSVEVEHHHRGLSRKSLFGRANRRHIASAARFFLANPDHLRGRAEVIAR